MQRPNNDWKAFGKKINFGWRKKAMKRFVVAFLECVLLLCVCVSPVLAARFDFPDPIGYVNDFAGVLSNDKALDAKLEAFAKSDSTEIFVVVVNELPENETIDTFVPYLTDEHPKWKAGQDKYDNGIILTAVMMTHDIRIDVGYGLEGALPDITAKSILNNEIVPEFREGNYDKGVEAGVDAIIEAVRGEYTAEVTGGSETGGESIGDMFCGCCFMFVFVIFPVLGGILGRTKSWWLGGVLGVVSGLIVAWFISVSFPSLGWIRYGSFVLAPVVLGIAGLIFDYIVSKTYRYEKGGRVGRIMNRTFSPSRSGGFGGFSSGGGGFRGGGGGSFGGGGARSKW